MDFHLTPNPEKRKKKKKRNRKTKKPLFFSYFGLILLIFRKKMIFLKKLEPVFRFYKYLPSYKEKTGIKLMSGYQEKL